MNGEGGYTYLANKYGIPSMYNIQKWVAVAIFERELQETEAALQNVADAVAQGLMSDTLLEKLKELEERKAGLQDTITNIAVSHTASYLDVDLILSDYAEVKDSPLAPMYKTFICSLIDRIDVGCYTVDITFKTGLDMYSSLDTTYNVPFDFRFLHTIPHARCINE